MEFTEEFWSKRYQEGSTGWDIGHVSTPLKEYFDQLENKDIKILIPGAGNAYEGEYLWNHGFKNIHIVDLSQVPLDNLKAKIPEIPDRQLIRANFFDLRDKYDLIVEQTFFCALHPTQREAYARKMFNLLNSNGKVVGLLFDFPLTESGPPFGGSKMEYQGYFSRYFNVDIMERAHNSIEPRKGNELFFKLSKKH